MLTLRMLNFQCIKMMPFLQSATLYRGHSHFTLGELDLCEIDANEKDTRAHMGKQTSQHPWCIGFFYFRATTETDKANLILALVHDSFHKLEGAFFHCKLPQHIQLHGRL